MFNDITPPQRRRNKRIEPPERPVQPPLHEQAKAVDPTFKTPEETAHEEPSPILPMVVTHTPVQPDAPKKRGGRFNFKNWHLTRKQKIIGAIAVVLLAFGAGAGWTLTHHKRTVVAEKPVHKTAPKPAPKIIYSTLTGLPVPDDSVNKRPVTAAMIENSLDARPQSGLGEAGVVFEAVAEGGVTRFMALFQDTAPDNIGPIRSARPYYVQWALGFDAAYAHVGGSPDALSDITAWGVHDMNQFSNGNSYHRISSRAAPHNVYTAVSTLNELEAAKGYTSTYTGFTRATKEAPVSPATTTSIDFHLSGPIYDPHYDYDASTNSYKRSENGEPHTDANGGQQISPKVVIGIVVPLGRGELDSSGAYYSDYNVLGSGTAYIFQNGAMVQGVWNKADNNAPLTFTDASGAPIPLAPGKTWISAISSTNNVSYK